MKTLLTLAILLTFNAHSKIYNCYYPGACNKLEECSFENIEKLYEEYQYSATVVKIVPNHVLMYNNSTYNSYNCDGECYGSLILHRGFGHEKTEVSVDRINNSYQILDWNSQQNIVVNKKVTFEGEDESNLVCKCSDDC